MMSAERQARTRVKELAHNASDEFDATILNNRVYEAVRGDHGNTDLKRVLTLAEGTYELAADRNRSVGDDDVASAAFGAATDLDDVVDGLVAETVAVALAELLEAIAEEDWTDVWSDEEIAAAKHEAREWLQANHEAAERAGVWDEVTA